MSPSSSTSYNFVVRVNGANVAALTCSTFVGNVCNITGQNVAVTNGQNLVIQVNKTAGSFTSRTATWTVDYVTP